jgi:hypothetical protein
MGDLGGVNAGKSGGRKWHNLSLPLLIKQGRSPKGCSLKNVNFPPMDSPVANYPFCSWSVIGARDGLYRSSLITRHLTSEFDGKRRE